MKYDAKIVTFEEAIAEPSIKRLRYDTDTENSTAYFRVDFQTAVLPARLSGAKYYLSGEVGSDNCYTKAQWWLIREIVRFQKNREMYGQVLQNLWNNGYFSMWCPRPHLADPTKIEFFADAAAGMADRPIVTSLAKFLRRVCPIYSDDYIRDLDASHRAAMSTEVEFLYGKEGLRTAYLEGPSSCMAKRYHENHIYSGHHPVDAYDVPGIGIAVGRDGNNRINARCIVYVNPSDETDKRMIRVYGDSSLGSRLARNGFIYKGLSGVALKALPLINQKPSQFTGPHKDKYLKIATYAAPYLDGPAGAHDSEHAHRNLLAIEGEDVLIPVSNEIAGSIHQAITSTGRIPEGGRAICGSGSSEGIASMVVVPRELLNYVCPITGAVTNLLTEPLGPAIWVWYEGKRQLVVGNSGVMDMFPHAVQQVIGTNRSWVETHFSDADKPITFTHDGTMYEESDDTRVRAGFLRWHPDYYPEKSAEWIRASARDLRNMMCFTELKGEIPYVVSMADCTEVLDVEDKENTDINRQRVSAQRVHQSMLTTEPLVRVHSLVAGRPTFVTSRVLTVKTATGRLVVPGLHHIVQLHDGEWTFSRNADTVYRCNNEIHVRRGQGEPLLAAGSDIVKKIAVHSVDTSFYNSRRLFSERRDTQWEDALWELLCVQDGHASFTATRVTETYRVGSISFLVDMVRITALLNSPDVLEKHKVRARNLVTIFTEMRPLYKAKWERWYMDEYGIEPPTRYGGTMPVYDVTLPPVPPPVVVSATSLTDLQAVAEAEAAPDPAEALPMAEVTIEWSATSRSQIMSEEQIVSGVAMMEAELAIPTIEL